jgi:hypothetical protein
MGARGAVSLLEKPSCEHAKAMIQPKFKVSAIDIKDPSVEAIALGGILFRHLACWREGNSR